jgi:hypothetical protein
MADLTDAPPVLDMAALKSATRSSPAAGAESFAVSVSMAPLKLHPKSSAMRGALMLP